MMSAINGEVTDLFIPVGRPQSSTSTTRTDASVDTTALSLSSKSITISPSTTVSSKISTRNAAAFSSKSDSPSSTRYTISGPAPDVRRRHNEPVTHSIRAKPERPNSVHIRRHSQKITGSPSSFHELTMRLSKATGTTVNDKSYTASSSTTQSPSLDRTKSTSNNPVQRGPAPTLLAHHNIKPADFNASGSIPNSSVATEDQMLISTETYPTEIAPAQLPRSNSQSSNRSDRSCPPASFPSGFYEKSTTQNPTVQSPSRQVMTKAMEAAKPTRSTSPLKFEVSGQDITHETPLNSKRPGHRRHQSDSTFSFRPKDPATFSSGATDLMRATFHNTLHFYTTCSHTSPPCTRPLDTPPKLDTSCQPPCSRIQGSCFDCDTAERRETESAILLSFNPRIASHLSDLDAIIAELESTSPVSPSSPAVSTSLIQSATQDESVGYTSLKSASRMGDARYNRPISPSSAVSDDDEAIPISVRMQALQERITVLTIQRDKEVRDLWRGYSQRWGPGTIGLLKGTEDHSTVGTPGTPHSRSSIDSGRSYHTPAEGRMKVDWIRDAKKQLDHVETESNL